MAFDAEKILPMADDVKVLPGGHGEGDDRGAGADEESVPCGAPAARGRRRVRPGLEAVRLAGAGEGGRRRRAGAGLAR